MAIGGPLLKGTSSTVRLLQWAGSVIVLGIFSYFLAYLAVHKLGIATYVRAVEGIAGAAVIYTFFAAILVCFIGGLTVSALLAIILDLGFTGAFIAVAVLTRGSAGSCRKEVLGTPFGTGNSIENNFSAQGSDGSTSFPNLHRACILQKVVFAVSIILAGLFLLSLLTEIALMRHHKKEKRYGPSPSNNYSSGSGKRFGFMNRRKNKTTRDAEMATAGTIHTDKVDSNGYRANGTAPPQATNY